jgi:hypothetical protein
MSRAELEDDDNESSADSETIADELEEVAKKWVVRVEEPTGQPEMEVARRILVAS